MVADPTTTTATTTRSSSCRDEVGVSVALLCLPPHQQVRRDEVGASVALLWESV